MSLFSLSYVCDVRLEEVLQSFIQHTDCVDLLAQERQVKKVRNSLLRGFHTSGHSALVCGTASRARDIRRFANDSRPLRSNKRPEGLEGLSQRDQVDLANILFAFSCRIFLLAASRGVWATMENPPKDEPSGLHVWWQS